MSIAMAPNEALTPRGVGMGTVHSRSLLIAGMVGGHVGAITCVGIAAALGGAVAMASAMIAGVLVIAFFGIGQGIVLRFADSRGHSLLVAALASYIVRVTTLGVLVSSYGAVQHRLILEPTVVAVTIIVTVITWLTAELVRFARMRIPAYDPPAGTHPGGES